MKYLSLFVLLYCCMFADAQITITSADMPQPGSTYIATGLAIDLAIDPTETGANHTWDFQQLDPLLSTTDTFTSLNGLSLLYQLLYSGANLADKTGFSIAIDQITLDAVYLIYKNGSSALEQYGFAGTFGGIPIPIIYGEKDLIYRFPLQFGNVDSSQSGFSFGLPGFGYVSQQRNRVNTVDGWGTVITPVGTYEALKVTSVITDVDSVYLDTLNTGTNVNLKSYEFKWLAQGTGTPVLQINAQDILGTPVITQITYQDTLLHTGVETISGFNEALVSLFPNPAAEWLHIHRFKSSHKPEIVYVRNISGQTILQYILVQDESYVDVSSWINGIYFLEIESDGMSQHTTLVIQH